MGDRFCTALLHKIIETCTDPDEASSGASRIRHHAPMLHQLSAKNLHGWSCSIIHYMLQRCDFTFTFKCSILLCWCSSSSSCFAPVTLAARLRSEQAPTQKAEAECMGRQRDALKLHTFVAGMLSMQRTLEERSLRRRSH